MSEWSIAEACSSSSLYILEIVWAYYGLAGQDSFTFSAEKWTKDCLLGVRKKYLIGKCNWNKSGRGVVVVGGVSGLLMWWCC